MRKYTGPNVKSPVMFFHYYFKITFLLLILVTQCPKCKQHTVWKFNNFSATRFNVKSIEANFGSQKTVILKFQEDIISIFATRHFVFMTDFSIVNFLLAKL